MGKFKNTRTIEYTKQRVRELSQKRLPATPPKNYPLDEKIYRQTLGNLLAAGHLKINGFESMKMENIIRSEKSCKIEDIHFHIGDQISPEDILVTLKI